jgi:hypothetical protein
MQGAPRLIDPVNGDELQDDRSNVLAVSPVAPAYKLTRQ